MKKIMFASISLIMTALVFLGLNSIVFAEGTVPVAENLELKTYLNTSVEGLLNAYDPEEDIVYYKITTQPRKGEIMVEQNGSFVYTPYEGKKGRDYFGYKAIDSQGNESQEATAIIRIEKNIQN